MKQKTKLILGISGALAAILLALLITAIVFISQVGVGVTPKSDEDLKQIGKEKFGMDTLLAYAPISERSVLNVQNTAAPLFLVVGLKGDEELCFIVPMMKSRTEEPYLVEWPLNRSFRSLMQGINDFAGKTVYESYRSDVQFYGDDEENYFSPDSGLKDVSWDVFFLIRVNKYVVGQMDGAPFYHALPV